MTHAADDFLAKLSADPHLPAEPLEDWLRENDRWTWDECLRAVLSVPDSDGPRLMAARWLEENAGTVPCGACDNGWLPKAGTPDAGMMSRCPACSGSGRVSDGRRERAEFVRVQCELARHPRQIEWLRRMPVDQWSGGADEGELLRRLVGLSQRCDQLVARYVADCGPWSRAFIKGVLGGDWLRLSAAWQWHWWRGFVESVSLPAADFLAHHEALFWSPDQRVPCPECVGWPTGYDLSPFNECPGCHRHVCPLCVSDPQFRASGACKICVNPEGTVPRPFVPTAQPIREVTLTTDPNDECWGGRVATWPRTFTHPRWPGLTFRLPGATAREQFDAIIGRVMTRHFLESLVTPPHHAGSHEIGRVDGDVAYITADPRVPRVRDVCELPDGRRVELTVAVVTPGSPNLRAVARCRFRQLAAR